MRVISITYFVMKPFSYFIPDNTVFKLGTVLWCLKCFLLRKQDWTLGIWNLRDNNNRRTGTWYHFRILILNTVSNGGTVVRMTLPPFFTRNNQYKNTISVIKIDFSFLCKMFKCLNLGLLIHRDSTCRQNLHQSIQNCKNAPHSGLWDH